MLLLVFLIIAEIILRCRGYYYSPIIFLPSQKKVSQLSKSDWRPFHSLKDNYCVYDPNLIWRPKKNYKMFNAQGFKGKELGLIKGEKEYRLFAIGDSNTLGSAECPSWVEYLGKIFKEENPNVTVINAGVWGYSSFQGVNRFEEVSKYKPDMVLISFGKNDGNRVTISDRQYVANKRILYLPYFSKLRIFQLLIAVSDIISIKYNLYNPFIPRVSHAEYYLNLDKIITKAREKNIKVVLLTLPFIGESLNDVWWKNFGPQYNTLTKRIAKQTGVKVIDIYTYFAGKKSYFTDECHFNDVGHKFAAKVIYYKIKGVIY